MEKNKNGNNRNRGLNTALLYVYIVQVICALLIFFSVNTIAESVFNTLSSLKDIMGEETFNSMYSLSSIRMFVILFILVCLAFSITGLVISAKKKSPQKKTLLIVFSAITLYESYELLSPLYAILSFTSLILSILLIRNKDVVTEEKPKEEKKPVTVKRFRQSKVKSDVVIKSILMILIYYIYFFSPLFTYITLPVIVEEIIFYGSLMGFAIGFYYKEYTQMFKAFKKDLKLSIKYIFKNLGKMVLVYFPFTIIIVLVFGQSTNQTTLIQLNPLSVLFLGVIYAPLVEETVFRGAIRKLIKNDLVFVLVSGILFGLIHTMGQEPTVLMTIANAVPYAVIGCYLAYMYTENNNMMYNIGLHSVYNLICSIITITAML